MSDFIVLVTRRRDVPYLARDIGRSTMLTRRRRIAQEATTSAAQAAAEQASETHEEEPSELATTIADQGASQGFLQKALRRLEMFCKKTSASGPRAFGRVTNKLWTYGASLDSYVAGLEGAFASLRGFVEGAVLKSNAGDGGRVMSTARHAISSNPILSGAALCGTMVGAAGSTIVGGVGLIMGTIAGAPFALLTGGLSIPFSAAVVGGAGCCVGAAAGSTCGAAGGALAVYGYQRARLPSAIGHVLAKVREGRNVPTPCRSSRA